MVPPRPRSWEFRPTFLALLAIAACQPLEPGEDPSALESELTLDANVRTLPIKSDRSLIITDLSGLAKVQDRISPGKILTEVGKAAITRWAPAEGDRSRYGRNELNKWVQTPWRSASGEYDDHDRLPFEKRLGVSGHPNPWAHLMDLWPQLGNADVGDGPFRLLAVVNRLDISGDVDDRGIIDAAKAPRTIGEGRLVFGLVDRAHEAQRNAPYPLTLIIEFRLPALDANFNVIDGFDYAGALFDDAARRTQLERWGLMWRQLSKWDPAHGNANQRQAFADHLWKIVNRFAQADNFVAMRGNVRLVGDNGVTEFELREWYMLKNGDWTLINRKPRDEPYRCADAKDLRNLVDFYWDAARQDVNMARVTPARPTKVIGYLIPRDIGNSPIPMAKDLTGCPMSGGEPVKFEMKGVDFNMTNRVTAPFGRVRRDTLWDLPGAEEAKRHQFAIRTCTGCHGKEAGIFGFHIAPRMPNQEAALSDFLTHGGGTDFSHGGATYRYNELSGRKRWLERVSTRDPSTQVFESLYRHDAL